MSFCSLADRGLFPIVWVFLFVLAACTPAPAQHVADATLVLQGSVFDSREGAIIEDGVVIFAGAAIGCSGHLEECRWPDETPVRTFDEATILPGFIDLHVHARSHYIGAFLPSGVTTIREANNTIAELRRLRDAEGGPRVFASGPLLDGPGSRISQMSQTDGRLGEYPLNEIMPIHAEHAEDAAGAVEALTEAGADLIKLYALLGQEAFEAAVVEARSRDIPAAADLGMLFTQGLSGAEVDIVQAAEVGVATVEHVSGLSLAYKRRGGDPMSPELDDTILDEIADALLKTDVAMVPTLANLVQFSDPGALSMSDLPGADRLPPYFQGHWNGLLGWAEQAHEQFAAASRLKHALLIRLHERGMLIGAGSDLPAAPYMLPGAALHQELEALVQTGLSPSEALQAATWNAALILEREDLGHLRASAQADVLVVEGDPSRDILDTRNVQAVWQNGREVDIPSAWDAVEMQLRAVIPDNTP